MLTPFRFFLVCLVMIGYTSQAEEIRVISYNAGLLTRSGWNLVPCTTERTEPQAKELLNLDPKVKFAVLLQEVWTRYGFDTYKRLSIEKGFTIFPSNYDDVAYNGEIIITNLPVVKKGFVPFPDDDHAYRGIRWMTVRSEKGPVVISNVHTSYSDASGFLPQHREQFNLIAKFLDVAKQAGYPIILGGDFNAGPNMSYRLEKYPSAKTIWENTILPVFTSRSLKPFGDESQNTWSQETNTLVSYPARIIRWMNWYEYGISEWDQNSARIDHIMASSSIRAIETGRSMTQPVALPWTCTGRGDAQGRTPLSDHYAVYARFVI